MDRYFKGIVLIIYSCSKNDKKSQLLYKLLTSIADANIKIYILNGSENLFEDYKIIDEKMYLKCNDNYDSLYIKTKILFKSIITMFPNLYGVIKMDDDIIPNINFMKNTIEMLLRSNIDYCGKISLIDGPMAATPSTHHINKCENIENKRPFILPECIYCSGPCYYLSKKAIKYFNKNCIDFFAEDIMVGLTFKNSVIKPMVCPLYYNEKSYTLLTNIQNFKDKTQHDYLTFIRLHGGLGNQLFQVATGLSYSKKNNSLPILIYESNNSISYPHSSITKSLEIVFPNINNLMIDDIQNLPIKRIDSDPSFLDAYSYKNLPSITNSNIMLNGYFQNTKYFNDIKEILQDCFINEEIREKIKLKFENINNSYFIHRRRGDYIGNKLYEIDYDSYYQKAINILSSKEKSINFYVVSDDIEYCKTYKYFKSDEKNKFNFIEQLDEIETLYLMTLCKGGITCNSSFSWWGSYLNDHPDKKIILPKQWLPNANVNMGYDNALLL